MVDLVPVDFDPFAAQAGGPRAAPQAGARLIPVDHDPFADEPSAAAKAGAFLKDVARSAESGVDAGVAGLIGAPNALIGLGEAGAGWAARKLGHLVGATPNSERPGAQSQPSIADGFPSAEAVSKSMEAQTGPAYKPQTTAGEVAHTVGEFAPNALAGGGTIAQRAAQVVVPALASEASGRVARTVAPELEGPARLVGGLVGGIGTAVAQAPRGAAAVMREGLDGVSPEQLDRAQALMQSSRDLPGGGVPLSLDEALNAVTGGQATRASQLARVVANSGGEGQKIASEFYAARPGQVDAAGRAAFQGVADQPAAPSALGAAIQDAARTAVDQTPQGMALTEARQAAGPRITPEQAGQVIQPELRQAYDRREGMRAALAEQDYRAAERAPEGIGIERTIPVERPGEPIVTQQRYSRPQFTDQAPAPLGPPPGRGDGTVLEAGPMSLGQFVAREGGLPLEGDVLATDLHKFNIPGAGNVARQGGKSIDNYWRERLIEEGYFKPDADGGMARDISSELLRKLQNEQRGVPSYPIGSNRSMGAGPTAGQLSDEWTNALSHAETRLDGDLTKAGVDPKSVHPDIRSRALGALMRGETADPLTAMERTISGLREPPSPLVKSTTVQDQVHDVRFGQANPQPVLDHIDEAMRSAKGPAVVALQQARRTLFEQDGKTIDLSVAGLHGARQAMSDLIDKAPAQTQRLLLGVRDRLDRTLSSVPEYEAARSGFEAASRNLDPFASGSAPGRIVAQDQASGRFSMPPEQVPGAIAEGPTSARDFASVASPEARRAFEGQLTTRLLDHATDATTGVIDGGKLRTALRENEDLLNQAPAVRDRIAGIAAAREGLSAVERSPLGRLMAKPEVEHAVGTLFGREPLAGGEREIGTAMGALAKADPQAAQQLARIHLETVFNDAVSEKRGLPAQYGGAGFASAVAGNPQQARNLEASIRALPNGDTLWTGLDRFLTTLKATGYRPQKGSDTAFNARIQEELKGGKSVAGAVTSALLNAAAGAGAAGAGGAMAGGLLAAKKTAADAFTKYQVARNGEAIARMLFDPKALPDLRALAKSAPGTKNALAFTNRLLTLAGSSTAPRERYR